MKKLACVLLSAVLMLSLSACSNQKTRLYAGACTYYADGGLMSFSEYLYKYDKNGNPVKECEYYNGNLNTTIEREYDSSGSFSEKKINRAVKFKRAFFNVTEILRPEAFYNHFSLILTGSIM